MGDLALSRNPTQIVPPAGWMSYPKLKGTRSLIHGSIPRTKPDFLQDAYQRGCDWEYDLKNGGHATMRFNTKGNLVLVEDELFDPDFLMITSDDSAGSSQSIPSLWSQDSELLNDQDFVFVS